MLSTKEFQHRLHSRPGRAHHQEGTPVSTGHPKHHTTLHVVQDETGMHTEGLLGGAHRRDPQFRQRPLERGRRTCGENSLRNHDVWNTQAREKGRNATSL